MLEEDQPMSPEILVLEQARLSPTPPIQLQSIQVEKLLPTPPPTKPIDHIYPYDYWPFILYQLYGISLFIIFFYSIFNYDCIHTILSDHHRIRSLRS